MKNPNIEHLTPEVIKDTLERLNRIIRPKALILNTKMKEQVLEAFPDIEEKIVLIGSDICELETGYLIDRNEIEKYIGGAES